MRWPRACVKVREAHPVCAPVSWSQSWNPTVLSVNTRTADAVARAGARASATASTHAVYPRTVKWSPSSSSASPSGTRHGTERDPAATRQPSSAASAGSGPHGATSRARWRTMASDGIRRSEYASTS